MDGGKSTFGGAAVCGVGDLSANHRKRKGSCIYAGFFGRGGISKQPPQIMNLMDKKGKKKKREGADPLHHLPHIGDLSETEAEYSLVGGGNLERVRNQCWDRQGASSMARRGKKQKRTPLKKEKMWLRVSIGNGAGKQPPTGWKKGPPRPGSWTRHAPMEGGSSRKDAVSRLNKKYGKQEKTWGGAHMGSNENGC